MPVMFSLKCPAKKRSGIDRRMVGWVCSPGGKVLFWRQLTLGLTNSFNVFTFPLNSIFGLAAKVFWALPKNKFLANLGLMEFMDP